MINIIVRNNCGTCIGRYRSTIVPRVGEVLDASNGQWVVTKVEHDIPGPIYVPLAYEDIGEQKEVVIYTAEL